MNQKFDSPSSNMVALVNSIVQGYNHAGGPIRALAQEPVQNSKDALKQRPVHVEYRLYIQKASDNNDGMYYILTVTDSNTKGLQGPILTSDEVRARRFDLSDDEIWAAFEGLGLSKDNPNTSGSRGQGKAAFLYHSRMPELESRGRGRMIMLYDTVLPNGEYRLGVRYANPGDGFLSPPFYNEEAKQIVSTNYEPRDGSVIKLGLPPLTDVGTRVIVPYLSEEAVNSIRNGEFAQWLQLCWWRAIQVGELTIDIFDETGVSSPVTIPPWWLDEPWRMRAPGRTSPNVKIYDDESVQRFKIKRVVLLYNESISDAEIEDVPSKFPQFQGVQLLRRQQWIETLSFDNYIPRDKRPGFRGFVEFDQSLEPELRGVENPQHTGFDGRNPHVKNIRRVVEEKVREFAETLGWTSQESTRPAPGADKEAAMEFLRFLAPKARSNRPSGGQAAEFGHQLSFEFTERWECELLLDFPDPKSTRINWGDSIRNVAVKVRLHPAQVHKRAKVSLTLTHADSKTSTVIVSSQDEELLDGEGLVKLGDFQIITGASTSGKIQCAEPGKWRLTAKVESAGTKVTQASRNMYVNKNPPERPDSKPYTMVHFMGELYVARATSHQQRRHHWRPNHCHKPHYR